MSLSPENFVNQLRDRNLTFYAGVPDSLLKSVCAYVDDHVPPSDHVICANEGSAVALALGYHLATNRAAVVYLQNSGVGNTVNPLMSLADEQVYSVPMLLLIGWRGEPGVKDEPQHLKQGLVTPDMLESMHIPFDIIGGDEGEAQVAIDRAAKHMQARNSPCAILVKKGAFDSYQSSRPDRTSHLPLSREQAIHGIIDSLEDTDIVVSTTGMASREVFEYREACRQGHSRDFLTVGGMGHASAIALGIAKQKQDRRVVCIDGDGSTIMHMGALAVNGVQSCPNLIHIVLNNGAHDSVGGQPTAAFDIDFPAIANAVGYYCHGQVSALSELNDALRTLEKVDKPGFLEVRCRTGSRKDLGRPTATPQQNKADFMEFLRQ